jgi:hypothetical protein
MEIEIGDVFESTIYFKVVGLLSSNLVECEVYIDNRVVITVEHKNTLLKMQKLSSLEKELI